VSAMITLRTRNLLLATGLGHVIARLSHVVANHGISPQRQEHIVQQLIEIETELEIERGLDRTVH